MDYLMSEPGNVAPLRVWMHLRLAQKVTLAVLVACVPIVLLGLWVAVFAANLVKVQVDENVGLSGQAEADRVSLAVEQAARTLLLASNDENFVANVDGLASSRGNVGAARRFEAYLNTVFAQNEPTGLAGIAVYGVGGTRIQAGEVSAQAQALQAEVGTSEELVGQAFVASPEAGTSGDILLPIVRHVPTSTERGAGVVIVSEWNVDRMLGGTGASEISDPMTQTLVLQPDDNGGLLVVAASDRDQLGRTVAFDANPRPGSGPVVRESSGVTGDEVVQSASRLALESGWVSVFEVDRATAYQDLDSVRLRLITVFIAAAMVIVLVVVLAFRTFARRLGRMTDLAEAVAGGDLTVRTGDVRRDELGRLSHAFDEMTRALAEDIARRERVEAQLAYQASHDALTGLPNREHLVHELEEMLLDDGDVISVLFVDLDGFKAVNDRLGHGAGDDLLVRVAERLRDVLRPADFLARLGGDEFTIVLRGLGVMESERLAGRVLAAIELPFIIGDEEINISASIGVASAAGDQSTEHLIHQADVAMYRAKAQGKGRSVRVTPKAMAELDDRVSILAQLREATTNGELELMLWPTADLRDGSLRGMEATVRWNHPERGVITPADFLPLAQNSGFATQIDEWVIVQAIDLFARWQADGLPVHDLEMSINLVQEVFLKTRGRQLMSEEIRRHGLRPSNFRIEVPETVLRTGPDALKEAFDMYRTLGVPVMLDRFGSDYSNLDLLPRFAIDSVKIDLHLISDLTNRLSSRALVGSLVTLAQTAGLRVAAAGVDDDATRVQLLELGCHNGQGLWLSDAVDEAGFVALLQANDLIGLS